MNNNNKTNDIMVTIRCAVYNHEPYIRQCLDGFVMQKTDFKFEAIVHDDASTDMTADIIREYAAKYPDIIKPIYETENQYSKHNGSLTRIFNEHTRGKYIAICEGDDYWTDPLKLQKQVDFLESHPDYTVCVHHYKMYYQDTQYMDEKIYPVETPKQGHFDLAYYVDDHGWFTQPLTTVYKKDALDINLIQEMKYYKDITFFYLLLKKGKGYLMSDCCGIYRIHQGGIFSCIPHYNKVLNNLLTLEEICRFDHNQFSARILYLNIEKQIPLVGLKFIIENRKLLYESYKIISKTYGKKESIFLFWKAMNLKSSIRNIFNMKLRRR